MLINGNNEPWLSRRHSLCKAFVFAAVGAGKKALTRKWLERDRPGIMKGLTYCTIHTMEMIAFRLRLMSLMKIDQLGLLV